MNKKPTTEQVAPESSGATKACTRCKQALPITEFHKDPSKKSGYGSNCKSCVSQRKSTYNSRPEVRAALKEMPKKKYDYKPLHNYDEQQGKALERRLIPLMTEEWRRLNKHERERSALEIAIAFFEKMKERRRRQAQSMEKFRSQNSKLFRERARMAYRAWSQRNPEKIKAATARRKAAGPAPRVKDIVEMWRTQGGLCVYCRSPLGNSPKDRSAYHLDHIYPIARGGTNALSNLQCLCPTCNMRKNSMLPIDFVRKMRAVA